MATYEGLRGFDWPTEFVVEYADGTRERLLRGDGVGVMPPADDPEGCGAVFAESPRKHPRNQQRGGRYIRLTELRAVYAPDGRLLWPDS
jgi:hypothetical protein